MMAKEWIKTFKMDDGEQIAAEIFFDDEAGEDVIKYRLQANFGEVSVKISNIPEGKIDELFATIGQKQAVNAYGMLRRSIDKLVAAE